MYKNILTFLSLLLLGGLTTAQAQFVYVTNADTVTITSYTGTNTVVTIPSTNANGMTVNNLGNGVSSVFASTGVVEVTVPNTVTNIANDAFYESFQLTNVVMGTNVLNIGNYAFYDCNSLTNATMPNSVTNVGNDAFSYCSVLYNLPLSSNLLNIGSYAFYECLALTNVTIPGSVTNIESDAFYDSGVTTLVIDDGVQTIDDSAFEYCPFLTNIAIPASVTSIAEYAFESCTKLASLTIPNGVTNIGDYAFDGDTGLTNITLGTNVNTIGGYAFYDCAALPSIFLPTSLTNLGQNVFYQCITLSAINVSATNAFFSSVGGVLFDKPGVTLLQYPPGMPGAYTIPAGVQNIATLAFYTCDGITSVSIPGNVTNIGTEAFELCPNLTNATLASGILTIQTSAFSSCVSLRSVAIPGSVISIGATAFADCSTLSNVTLAAGIESIGNAAFQECYDLTSITIPNTVTNIGEDAFYESGLTNVTLVSGIGSVGAYAFEYCYNLGSITIPGSVTNIGANAFDDSGLTNIILSSGVNGISADAFEYCQALTSIIIPGSVSSIGNYAFYLCASLTNVTISNGVTSIGNYAFQSCASLANVTMPNSLTNIGIEAFDDTGLTNVTIPLNVSSIGDEAFNECFLLAGITVAESNLYYSSSNGVLFDENQYVLLQYPGGNTASNYTMPNTVTEIGDYAFYENTNLVSVTFGVGVTNIESFAFFDATKLASVSFSTNLISIGQEAFTLCSSLATLTLPASLTTLNEDVFDDCTRLTNVTFGSGLTSLTDYVFYDCPNLTTLYFEGNAPSVDPTVFDIDPIEQVYYTPGTSGWSSTFDGFPATILDANSPSGSLEVTINPAAVVSDGAQWQVDGGVLQNSGATVLDLSVGTHTVSFTAVIGWTSPSNQSVTVSSNSTATATATYIEQPQYEFTYTTNTDGTLTITSYTGPAGAVVIPPIITGRQVTVIAANAFDEDGLTSVVIPSSVTSIDFEAFYQCNNLTNAIIPGSITNMGNYAFSDSALTSVTISNGITVIGYEAFLGCYNLASVTIPNSVTNIEAEAFYECESLTNVVIGEAVASFGEQVFAACPLHTLYFAGNAPTADSSLFIDDTISDITVYYLPGTTGWGSTYEGARTELLSPFTFTTNADNTLTIIGYNGPGGAIVIPALISNSIVSRIGSNVFDNNETITSVTISGNVTNIGSYAFSDATNLTSIYFQGNAPTVGSNVFNFDSNATVYYEPGSSDWGSTFDGLRTEADTSPFIFTNLFSFSVFPDGIDPQAAVVQGADGSFYGTTLSGGSNYDSGTVFKVTTNGVATVLHEFTGGADGGNSQGALTVGNDGNFYGTTFIGGANNSGTVFKITPEGTFTSLYSFTYGDDGAEPSAGLALGNDGNFYGTTSQGGSNGWGAIFKITTNGAFTSLYSFTNGLDGRSPEAAPVQGTDGNFYGTTYYGGSNGYGTVFEMTTTGHLHSLYSFTNGADGNYPNTALVQDGGSFYGTTYSGGTNGGEGTVFRISTNGALTSLYAFTYSYDDYGEYRFGYYSGMSPSGGLTLGANGNLLGTTSSGGDGYGTVFTITTNGALTTLYTFMGGSDGAYPKAGLVQGNDGNFYGTATAGGVGTGAGGNGAVFKVTTNGTLTAFYAFPGLNNGNTPSALVHGVDGNFYGSTYYGGTNGANGTIFKITTNGDLTSLYSFTGDNDGGNPSALTQGNDGNFYGTTQDGGVWGAGTIFSVSPGGVLDTLYSFTDGNDGGYPSSGLVEGGDGNFYGTTAYSGAYGDGNVFKLAPNGQFKTLYAFGSIEQPVRNTNSQFIYATNVNCTNDVCVTNIVVTTNIYYTTNNYIALDGAYPNSLVLGFNGNFYGTTQSGGANGNNGLVFEMTPDGGMTALYSFCGGNDGGAPAVALTQAGNGNFYGSTTYGGDYGNGTLFEMTPTGTLTTLYSFEGECDGSSPSLLLAGVDGNFYATTSYGGTNYEGNVFELSSDDMTTNLYSFSGFNDGGVPTAALAQGSDGSLYGTTSSGAVGRAGGVFRLSGNGLPSPLPVITLQPVNPPATQTGASATMTVNAAGGAPLSYQWQHNGLPIPNDDDDFSGVNLATLTVAAAAPGDAGAYSVIVSNSYGATTSSNAVLSLLADTNAAEDYTAGTNYLAVGDYALASYSFSNAVYFSSTNPTYNFFFAATELLGLPQEAAGSNFLSRIGFGSLGRDIFNWQADAPTNAQGRLEIPDTTPPLNADEFTAQLRTNVLPAIVVAQSNLTQIANTNFTVLLTTSETHAGSVTVDWGDVQMLRVLGNTAELLIYTTYSWNLNAQLTTVTNLLGQDGSIEQLLTNYPSLLTTTSTADLPAAKGAFTNAINEYFIASQFIRSRPCGQTRLFNLDTNKLREEFQFRETLSNLLASLNGPTTLTVAPNITVSAQAFFDGSFDLRAYLPQFQGDEFVWDSFPDTTFGGVLSGVTEAQAGKLLRKRSHLETALDLPGVALSVLYNFTNYSGQTGVVQGTDGNLYGTLAYGGPYIAYDSDYGTGFGSVFRVTTNGQFSVLYSFGTVHSVGSNVFDKGDLPITNYYYNPLDGAYPNALVLGNDGNLYGTAASGGQNDSGTVFKITTSGQLTVLYSFGTATDQYANTPAAALVQGTDGRFYGTTEEGGEGTNSGVGGGTIFAISSEGTFTLLYSFPGQDRDYATNAIYGENPASPLVQGNDGNFYGTTPSGGVTSTNIYFEGGTPYFTNYAYGYGTLFKITPSGQLSLLYTFGTQQDDFGDPLDGAMPNGLALGADGNLYGTTQFGGSNDDEIGYYGYIDYDGDSGNGDGTLFRISPAQSNSFTTLVSFDSHFPDGYNPIGSLVTGSGGLFYGAASAGGANQRGAIFAVNTTTAAVTNILWFDTPSGGYGANLQNYNGFPNPFPSALTLGLDGNLYGTTTDNGTNGDGTIYELNVHGVGSLVVSLDSPANGQTLSAPASFSLSATVTTSFTNTAVQFYSGSTLLATVPAPPYTFAISDLAAGTYAFTAVATNINGSSALSETAYVTVNSPGTTLIDFDPLDADGAPVTGGSLASYLAQFGVNISGVSPGTAVAVENQASLAGGGFVIAPSMPNVLTQIGSNGPVDFTIGFSSLLSQFTFTRPELTPNPFVSHPAWAAAAFDSLGIMLDEVGEPQISSSTNVPAQTYTLSGGGIASVEFSSEGSGFNTFNAMLLDNFVLTDGNASDLPPSVLITSPTPGQVFTSATVPITVETSPGSGEVTSVSYYNNGSLIGTESTSPFSFDWTPAPNGAALLTAVAVNNSGLSITSAPVAVTVATGFAILTPPVSQTVGVGSKTTFTVSATETNVTYQWRLNGVNIPGASLSSYTIGTTPLSAAGAYTVAVTSGGQTITSPAAELTVLGPPTLGAPTIATNNGNIVLTVTANDSVAFYYKWQLNGNGIPGATNTCSPGTANISYVISNAAPFDSGEYQVVVANAVASQESSVIEVSVGFGTPVTTNSNFASRLALGVLTNGVGVSGINNSSSVAPADGPAEIAGKPAGGFLWYSWTAPFTGVISLTTRGSSFDTLMGVYTGNSVSSLTPVAEDDDSGGFFTSLVSFNCVQGTNYDIAVAGYQGAVGTVVLALSPGPPLLPGPTNGYSVGGAEPVITVEPVNQLVTAGATVTLSVTATGATGYQWYFADVPVANANSASLVISNFPASAVGNYYVLATNSFDSVQSDIVAIQIASETQNGKTATLLVDKFGDAVDLTTGITTTRFKPEDGGGDTGGFTLSQSFSTVGATKEEGEPNHAGQPGGASYWYSYTATNNGTLQFNCTGSTFNAILAVYTGSGASFASLTAVGSGYTTNYLEEGQPTVVLSNVVAGSQYFIAVDGYQGASGSAMINIAFNPGPITVNTNTITNNSPSITITSPAVNYLTTMSNVLVKGTAKITSGTPALSFVQISVNGGPFGPATLAGTAWSTNVTLMPGPNTIIAQGISVAGTNVNFASIPATRTVFYDVTKPVSTDKATLTLLRIGDGTFSGVPNPPSLEIGKIYTVKAVPDKDWIFANWNIGTNTNNLSVYSESASTAFDMSSNLILQANFVTNPFPSVAGVYNGLFYPAAGVSAASSGFFTATLAATGQGAYSGKLLLDGGTYPVTGTFDLDGDAEQIVERSGNTSLTVDLQLDLTGGNDQMTGTVSENAANGWIAEILADRLIFNSKTNPATEFTGKYTLIIPPGSGAPTNEPGGYGYATLAGTSAGVVSLSGSLADNTAISQSATVSKDGNIPLYVSLYSRKGLLMGWLTLSGQTSSQPAQTVTGANVAWIKTNISKALYSEGFTNTNVTVLGSIYSGGFTLTNATLTISNGDLASGLMVTNVTTAGNRLIVPGNEVTGAITPGTGVLTVTYKPPGGHSVTAKGVVLQDVAGTNAAGWFLGASQSGYFLLQQ